MSPSPDGSASDPLSVLEEEHVCHRRMCDILEAIADSLPDMIDCSMCASMASVLKVDLPAHHRGEEKGLFPLLERRAMPEDNLPEILAQLRREHAFDEGFAEELSDLLHDLSRGRPPANPDMAGYMLRGFFESYRRHIQLEEAVILPLARRRLTEDDLEALSRDLARRAS